MKSDIFVRKAEDEDIDEIAEIAAKEIESAWSVESIASDFKQNEAAVYIVACRRFTNNDNISAEPYNTVEAAETAGFCAFHIAADEGEIMQIAVKDGFKRKGIGSKMMEEALKLLGKKGGSIMHLEVSEKNESAIRMYGKLGFEQAGCRKGYYKSGEAAVLMSKKLNISNTDEE